jgi:hypothetical protein
MMYARTNPVMEPAEVIDTQQAIFNSGGLLEMKDSFGEVEIIGWDQPQIEVVVTKTTQKRYPLDEIDRGIAELDRVAVTTETVSDDHIVIRTGVASRGGVLRPVKGKSNVHLVYQVHVPRMTRLIVAHDAGEVKVHDVTANMVVMNRAGDIEISLPENERYAIDAKARIGGINSEWCTESHGVNDVADDGAEAHHVHLRVGVGDITLRKSHLETGIETEVD